ncbi:MAG: hypothetical protein KJ774_11290 [Firmicutes bacterium]|nr:hypothetical protein [Bacillota bacterium]
MVNQILTIFLVGLAIIYMSGSAYMFLTFIRDDIRSERKKKREQQNQ